MFLCNYCGTMCLASDVVPCAECGTMICESCAVLHTDGRDYCKKCAAEKDEG